MPPSAAALGCRWRHPRGSHCTIDRDQQLVDPPIARNHSSLLGWSTGKRKKTLPNQRKMMRKFLDIAYPCIWVVPKATTGVIPSLVHLHHAELTVWTPRPQHCLLRCVASNITHQSEVTLAFQWEIGFEIFWLLMPQSRTKLCPSPLHEAIIECCEKKPMEWMVVYIEGGWLGGGPFDLWEGKRSSDS
jgi:hypothetical protein